MDMYEAFEQVDIIATYQKKPVKLGNYPPTTQLEQIAVLTNSVLSEAGLPLSEIDGLVCLPINESRLFAPSTVGDYLGLRLNYADLVDVGGASALAMLWRAYLAVASGQSNLVLCVIPGGIPPVTTEEDVNLLKYGASSSKFGSPQAEFELPLGFWGQNISYAIAAQDYRQRFGYDDDAVSKLVVSHRENAQLNKDAIFYGKPLTAEDVQASRVVVDPIRKLEIVMPVAGGGAFLVGSTKRYGNQNKRQIKPVGYAECYSEKSLYHRSDMLDTPLKYAAARALDAAKFKISDINAYQLYDCYAITVLLGLEDIGLCARGEAAAFILDNDFSFVGSVPLNTGGGQLGFGQAGMAGGLVQLFEAISQLRHELDDRQIPKCDSVLVTGTGGVLSEQNAMLLVAG